MPYCSIAGHHSSNVADLFYINQLKSNNFVRKNVNFLFIVVTLMDSLFSYLIH